MNGTESVLYSFGANPNDSTYPAAALIQGSDGSFYGTTLDGGADNHGTIFQVTPSGERHRNRPVLLRRERQRRRLASASEPAPGEHGNFYGRTYDGGTYNQGTVFKLTPE